jgi:hypothetical protein
MLNHRISLSLLLAAVGLTALVAPSEAQIRASEPSTVTQAIDGTVITIDYFRPRARGRSPLFGHDSVVWEHVWTPGANWATTISFENPIEFEGVPLEPGTYGIWMVMSEDEFLPEELLLDPERRNFHTDPPAPAEGQIHLPLTRTEAPFTEVLTWGFEDIRSDGGTLALRWGTLRIAFDVKVEPSMRQTVTEEEAEPIVGSYEMTLMGPNGEPSAPFSFTISMAEDGTLRGDMDGVDTGQPADEFFNTLDMMLLPFAEGVFAPGEVYDGELREVWAGWFFEFDVDEEHATAFQLRGPEDEVMAEGNYRD